MTPHEQLADLQRGTDNKRRLQSLQVVFEVCQEQAERGSHNFSVAMIGRLSKERGGPSARSIHNPSGRSYKAIIDAWKAHCGQPEPLGRQGKNGKYEPILRKIEDPAVRAVFEHMAAENSRLHGQVNLLKSVTTLQIDLRQATRNGDAATGAAETTAGTLTYAQQAALREAISEYTFRANDWREHEDGSVTNAAGRLIFDPGFTTAIKRLLTG